MFLLSYLKALAMQDAHDLAPVASELWRHARQEHAIREWLDHATLDCLFAVQFIIATT
jgi:hypothetical protein